MNSLCETCNKPRTQSCFKCKGKDATKCLKCSDQYKMIGSRCYCVTCIKCSSCNEDCFDEYVCCKKLKGVSTCLQHDRNLGICPDCSEHRGVCSVCNIYKTNLWLHSCGKFCSDCVPIPSNTSEDYHVKGCPIGGTECSNFIIEYEGCMESCPCIHNCILNGRKIDFDAVDIKNWFIKHGKTVPPHFDQEYFNCFEHLVKFDEDDY